MNADIPSGRTAASPGPFNLAGHTLGKYRLIEKVGQGGMAQVYKAYQPDLDRYVAIKVLHPHLTGDEDFAARFQREARAIAALEHPNILRVYDYDMDDGLAFLVMEYLEGLNLRERLRDMSCRGESMSLAEVGQVVCALADALDHAHRQGVVHRDLKPSNVIVTTSGRPVLTDFGIARMVDTTTITGSGGALGTPAYMSPEQGKGQPGDARSDVYALGILLYQLCTGQLPFDADTPYAIILKHITAPLPSPRTLRPDLPESIVRVILKALSKNPNDRFQSAGEMSQALRASELREITPLAPRPREAALGRRRRILIGTGLAAIAGILIAGGLLLTRQMPREQAGLTPAAIITPAPAASTTDHALLILRGQAVTGDTWLDPDTPDDFWDTTDLVHLQGPLTPDRVLLRFDLASLPANAKIISATLTLRIELWGEDSFPGAAVIYRIMTPWEPAQANYNRPWSKPGLLAGVDYDSSPLDLAPMPDEGWMTLNISQTVELWRSARQLNYGLVLMMSADSHNQAHHRVYLSEQPDPADQPTLRIAYEVAP